MSNTRKRWHRALTFYCSREDYDVIHAHCKQTLCRSFSEYARKVLTATPVAITSRDLTMDKLIDALIQTRSMVEAVLSHPGFGGDDKTALQGLIEEIKSKINQLANICIPK